MVAGDPVKRGGCHPLGVKSLIFPLGKFENTILWVSTRCSDVRTTGLFSFPCRFGIALGDLLLTLSRRPEIVFASSSFLVFC